jgi:DNA-binding transcriptional ArsR family regulator
MVNYSAALDATFSALSDPTRRAILARLSRGDVNVTELAEPFDVSLPAVTKHLNVLQRAGLLVREKEGRVRRCQLVASPLKQAADWIERYRRFWEGQLDSLARYLEEAEREQIPGKEDAGKWQRPRRSARKSRRPRSP